ncbi:Wall-associated receptor kinase-like 8 [Morella rubra]|uniref:Wall-associated receptor kinase-like 8 n=1 Tax=Morella rubra TaxID=262757 RepID=A0A6A1WEF2_9ROSI|nr:Wall-associated receptor kinase-like 8 [Morella rubra]
MGGSVRSLAFICSCKHDYEGNPYFPEGSQDIDEFADLNHSPCSKRYLSYESGSPYEKMGCKISRGLTNATRLTTPGVSTRIGIPFLLICGWGSYKGLKKRKMMKCKEKFFKRNGELLLQQQLSSSEVNVGNPNLFTSKDLEKATDHFNVNRILGQEGQGTVYKAMLPDGKIIAVKKSKIEVPLLVYEFIPNRTLFQYLHHRNEDFSLTWDMCLRIATEVVGALFYLHSAVSSPVYHRDIKSTNILLDENYRAKIVNFRTSRSVAVDQSHLTTQVHGTFGYLDPNIHKMSGVKRARTTRTGTGSSSQEQEVADPMMTLERRMEYLRGRPVAKERPVTLSDFDQLIVRGALPLPALRVPGISSSALVD